MGLFSSIGSFFGPVGGVIGGVADGLLGMKSDKDKSKAQQQAAQQAAQLNYEQQKEFAQHGIRWRVEDAKEAGLHPLAALGAQSPSYTPTFQSDAFYQAPNSSIAASGFKAMGQNIDRAKAAKMQAEDRELENSWKLAQIERLKAETTLSQAQASKMIVDSQQLPPSLAKTNTKDDLASQGQLKFDSGLSDMFEMLVNHRGELELFPSQKYSQIFEEKPWGADVLPLLQSGGITLARRFGLEDKPVRANGKWYIFDTRYKTWLPYMGTPPRPGSISVEYPKRPPNLDRLANIH